MPVTAFQVNYPLVHDITNIVTVGNLARITIGAHLFLVGDSVTIVNVNQPSNLNGTFPIVATVPGATIDVAVVPNAAYVAPVVATDDKAMLVMNAPDRRPRDGQGGREGMAEYVDGDHHSIFQRSRLVTNVVADRVVFYFEPGLYIIRVPPNATAGTEYYGRINKALTDTFDPRVDYTLAPHIADTDPTEALTATEARRRFVLRQGDLYLSLRRFKFSAYTKVGMLSTSVGGELLVVELGTN